MASIFNSYFNGDDGDDTDNDDDGDGDGDGDAQCGSKQWVVAGGAAVFESECKAQTFIPGLPTGYCCFIVTMMMIFYDCGDDQNEDHYHTDYLLKVVNRDSET